MRANENRACDDRHRRGPIFPPTFSLSRAARPCWAEHKEGDMTYLLYPFAMAFIVFGGILAGA